MASTGDGSTSSPSLVDEQTEASAPLSADTVATNDDLLTTILTLLQPKPLMRFKSVSKHWLSLIFSPRFSHLHTRLNPNPKPSAIFFYPIREDSEIEYEFVPLNNPSSLSRSPPFRSLRFGSDPSCIVVKSSCNGLLLCSTLKTNYHDMFNPTTYCIYNPTTKQVSPLSPPLGGDWMSSSSTRYSLAFDPLKSSHYKVVMVRSASGTTAIGNVVMYNVRSEPFIPKQMFEIHIYSSESESWKKHEKEIEWPNFPMFDKGVYLNGRMHWASKKDGSICFDVDQERRRRMPKLPGFRGWDETVLRYFDVSGEDLYIVDIQGFEVMVIDVYVLAKDYSVWSRKHKVDMNELLGKYPSMIPDPSAVLSLDFYNLSLLSIVQAGEDDELVIHISGKVISYGCKSKMVKELRYPLPGEVDKIPSYRIRSFDGHFYSETLACCA